MVWFCGMLNGYMVTLMWIRNGKYIGIRTSQTCSAYQIVIIDIVVNMGHGNKMFVGNVSQFENFFYFFNCFH